MTNNNIDVNELINALNGQVASMNLELTIARLQIAQLQKLFSEYANKTPGSNDDEFTTPPSRNKSK